jgi:hypothetical protein
MHEENGRGNRFKLSPSFPPKARGRWGFGAEVTYRIVRVTLVRVGGLIKKPHPISRRF